MFRISKIAGVALVVGSVALAGCGSTDTAVPTQPFPTSTASETSPSTVPSTTSSTSPSPSQSPPPNSPNDSSSPSPTVDADGNPIADAILESLAKPDARVSVTEPALVGISTSLNASASIDPIGYIDKYEWDFDGDGIFDKTSKGPAVLHTFTEVGEATVTVRITNDIGETDMASVTFSVENLPADYATDVPDAPPAPTVVAGESSVSITINPSASGPVARYYTVIEAKSGNVWMLLLADEKGNPVYTDEKGDPADSIVFEDLPKNKSFAFSVFATNERGESELSSASPAVTPK